MVALWYWLCPFICNLLSNSKAVMVYTQYLTPSTTATSISITQYSPTIIAINSNIHTIYTERMVNNQPQASVEDDKGKNEM